MLERCRPRDAAGRLVRSERDPRGAASLLEFAPPTPRPARRAGPRDQRDHRARRAPTCSRRRAMGGTSWIDAMIGVARRLGLRASATFVPVPIGTSVAPAVTLGAFDWLPRLDAEQLVSSGRASSGFYAGSLAARRPGATGQPVSRRMDIVARLSLDDRTPAVEGRPGWRSMPARAQRPVLPGQPGLRGPRRLSAHPWGTRGSSRLAAWLRRRRRRATLCDPTGLYKGDISVAVLAAELARPGRQRCRCSAPAREALDRSPP